MRVSAMDLAMSYLASRDRTRKEILLYLTDKGFDTSDISSVIQRLEELRLIDDRKYAENFVRSRLASKPHSKMSLYHQLLSHQIPEQIIESVLDDIPEDSDYENALLLAVKFFRQFRDLDPVLRRQRVLSRLQFRGYTYDISKRVFEYVEADEEENI